MRKSGVFILSHGRPDKVYTYDTIRKLGYDGPIVIVCDDQDETIQKYKDNFGEDNVMVFDKMEQVRKCDTFSNNPKMGVILYARNVCFELAEKLGWTHFVELDDDYFSFIHQYVGKDDNGLSVMKRIVITDRLGELFDATFDLLDDTNALTVAFAQGGDNIGGVYNTQLMTHLTKRKAMNSFFCRTDRPFKFSGYVNEDVNFYTMNGMRGELVFQTNRVYLNQHQTQ